MRKKPREPAKGTRSHVNEIQAARNSVARRAVCGSSPQDGLRLTKPIGLRRCFAVSPLSTHCYRIPSTARTPLVAIGFDLGLDLLYRHRRDIGSGECRHRLAQLLDMLARKVPATSIRSLRASVIRPPVPLRGGGWLRRDSFNSSVVMVSRPSIERQHPQGHPPSARIGHFFLRSPRQVQRRGDGSGKAMLL
jgi:hypothetical protein